MGDIHQRSDLSAEPIEMVNGRGAEVARCRVHDGPPDEQAGGMKPRKHVLPADDIKTAAPVDLIPEPLRVLDEEVLLREPHPLGRRTVQGGVDGGIPPFTLLRGVERLYGASQRATDERGDVPA